MDTRDQLILCFYLIFKCTMQHYWKKRKGEIVKCTKIIYIFIAKIMMKCDGHLYKM